MHVTYSSFVMDCVAHWLVSADCVLGLHVLNGKKALQLLLFSRWQGPDLGVTHREYTSLISLGYHMCKW
jgi:hypothetical protein